VKFLKTAQTSYTSSADPRLSQLLVIVSGEASVLLRFQEPNVSKQFVVLTKQKNLISTMLKMCLYFPKCLLVKHFEPF